MGFDYNARLANVINALTSYNTTTSSADLSGSLYERIANENILAIDPELTTPRADRLPAIYVTISNKDEEYSAIGATGVNNNKKMATVNYNVFGIIGKYGAYEEQSTTLKDIYTLAGNIEAVFQNEYRLSNTAMYCNPVSTEFSPPITIGDGFAKAVLIKLQARYMFR